MGDLGDWKNIRLGWESKFNFGVELDVSTDSGINSPYTLSNQHGLNVGYALPFHKNFHLIPEFTWNTSILTREIKGDGTSTLDNDMFTLGVVLNIPFAFTESPHEIALRIPVRGVLNTLNGKADIGSSELADLDLLTGGLQTGLELSYCGAKLGWNMHVIAAPSFNMGDYVEGATSLAKMQGYSDSIYHSLAVGLDAGDLTRCIAGHVSNSSSGPDPVADANEKLDTFKGGLDKLTQDIATYKSNTIDANKNAARSQMAHCFNTLKTQAEAAKNQARDNDVDLRFTALSTRLDTLKADYDAIATPPPSTPETDGPDTDEAPPPVDGAPEAPKKPTPTQVANAYVRLAERKLASAQDAFDKKDYNKAKRLLQEAQAAAATADKNATKAKITDSIKSKTDAIRSSVTELLGKITATIAADKAKAADEVTRRKAAEKPAEDPPPAKQPPPEAKPPVANPPKKSGDDL